MPYSAVNGIKIYYDVSGAGLPLVLVHANPFDRRLWVYQVAHFSSFFKVIAVDLRGYGYSDKPMTPTTLKMLSEDVLSVCRQENVDKAIVAGISVGGNVALQLGVDHPEIFQALVIIGCSSGPSDHRKRIEGYLTQGVRRYRIEHLKALVSPEFAASRLGKYLLGIFTDTDPKLNPEALCRIFEALQVKDLTSRLGELKMPVLTMNGEFDGALPRTRAMSEKIAGATHRVIPGTGHACCIEQPALFNEIVRDFLTQHNFLD